MPAPAPRILVVEDDEAIRVLLASALRRESFDVDTAADGGAALRLTAEHEYAVILLDLMMPGVNGFEFIDAYHRSGASRRSVVIVITAFDDRIITRLIDPRVHAVLRKPFDITELVGLVREVSKIWMACTSSAPASPLPATAEDAPKSRPDA